MLLPRLLILALAYSFFLNHHQRFTFAGNFPTPSPYSPMSTLPPTSTSPIPKPQQLLFGRGNLIATLVIILITLLNILVYKLRQFQESNSGEELRIPSSSASERLCRRFSLAEILSATHNFHNSLIIGKGGFGKVYRGVIDNGATTVAIKRLNSMSKQGAPEFWTEIGMLSKFRHSHLVSLIGYCDIYNEMIIVYEYMAHGTLADHLYKIGRNGGDISPLSWVQRLKICIGAARGLDYLHTGTGVKRRVIHRDVKSTNILLDENWAAKISDFGMSKIGPADQSCTHVSTNVKGTFGYIDPKYFLTRKLTKKSDVYAFGVVLFEVLCGRPAVDLSLPEDQHGLAWWVQHCIKGGTIDQIIDPNLSGQILSNCLTVFVQTADQCLHNCPEKRPTMAEVVAWLEFALALQEKRDNCIVKDEIFNSRGAYDSLDHMDYSTEQDEKSDGIIPLEANGRQPPIKPAERMTFMKKARLFFLGPTREISVHGDPNPSSVKRNNNISWGKNGLPNKDGGGVQLVLPNQQIVTLSSVHRVANPSENKKSNNNSSINNALTKKAPCEQMVTPNLKMFTYAELKIATSNFRLDLVLGEGGSVFKGWVDEKTYAPSKVGIGMLVAIKKFNLGGYHGFKEWQSEVKLLGRFCHPNLVKLLGYCWEDEEFLVVYEYMNKGSLENHLFRNGAEALSWVKRLKIAIGAARGLSFLHTADNPIIYHDLKTSNILLDKDFNAKLSDFGSAKLGPVEGCTHITTPVMGSYGYAAPEYINTGHLYVKSDVYSFGAVLLEILSGLRAFDVNRSSEKKILVDWATPFLSNKRKFKRVVDPRLEHDYPPKGAFRLAVLALKCLEHDRKKRPSMDEVLDTLEQIHAIKMKPKDNSKASGKHSITQRQE